MNHCEDSQLHICWYYLLVFLSNYKPCFLFLNIPFVIFVGLICLKKYINLSVSHSGLAIKKEMHWWFYNEPGKALTHLFNLCNSKVNHQWATGKLFWAKNPYRTLWWFELLELSKIHSSHNSFVLKVLLRQ